jgi:hypothetical protein
MTKPTNTPIDTTRRNLLTLAAGGAVAAAIPADARAGHAADPIFASIAEHQASIQKTDRASETLAAAGPEGDWRPTHAALVAWGAAATALIETAPTTRAGLRALAAHLRDEERNRGALLLYIRRPCGSGWMCGGPEAVDWLIAKRAAEIDGVTVQS